MNIDTTNIRTCLASVNLDGIMDPDGQNRFVALGWCAKYRDENRVLLSTAIRAFNEMHADDRRCAIDGLLQEWSQESPQR